jgi:hypothetical protein
LFVEFDGTRIEISDSGHSPLLARACCAAIVTVVARTAKERLNFYSTVDRYAIFIGLTPL